MNTSLIKGGNKHVTCVSSVCFRNIAGNGSSFIFGIAEIWGGGGSQLNISVEILLTENNHA